MSKNPHRKSGQAVQNICVGLAFLVSGIVICPLFRPFFHIFPYYSVGTDIVDWIFCAFFSTLGIGGFYMGHIDGSRWRGRVDGSRYPEATFWIDEADDFAD